MNYVLAAIFSLNSFASTLYVTGDAPIGQLTAASIQVTAGETGSFSSSSHYDKTFSVLVTGEEGEMGAGFLVVSAYLFATSSSSPDFPLLSWSSMSEPFQATSGGGAPYGGTGAAVIGFFPFVFGIEEEVRFVADSFVRLDVREGVGVGVGGGVLNVVAMTLFNGPTRVWSQEEGRDVDATVRFREMPEPGSAAMIAAGLAGLAAARRKRSKMRDEKELIAEFTDVRIHADYRDYLAQYPERFLGGWPKADPWGAYFVVIHGDAEKGTEGRWFVLSPMRESERQDFIHGLAGWLAGWVGEAVTIWRHPPAMLYTGAQADLVLRMEKGSAQRVQMVQKRNT